MSTDSCKDIVVYNIPKKLLEEFDEKVVKKRYPGGRSEAIRDLMRKAIDKAAV